MKPISKLSSGLGRIKKTAFAMIIVMAWLGNFLPPLSAQALAQSAGGCPTSGITSSTGAINLTSNCQVNGNIILSGTASLTMTGATLTVSGNIVLNDQAMLTVTNGTLAFPQTYNRQYSVYLDNNSQLTLSSSTVITNGTSANNFYVTIIAFNASSVSVQNSTLSANNNWLLGFFYDQSNLSVSASQNVPTEIYPADSSTISVTSNSTFATLYISFLSGSNGTINVPQYDTDGYFNFNFGGDTGFTYSVSMTDSKCRLGLASYPGSTMTVNGDGTSGTNDVELIFGYYISNNTAPVSLNGLVVGSNVTRQFTDQGRTLSLNNVNLNPLTWEVYVSQSNGFPVTISNSTINELGVLTGGLVNISNSTLQLAETASLGPGSQLNIMSSDIWSSAIEALSGGQMTIANSQIHGNFIIALDTGSTITMSSVTEDRNGTLSACTDPVHPPITNNGKPLCNPRNPPAQCSQVSTLSGGVVTGMPACPPS
jgi:hypothetical protein